ncbi:MAG: hypothetical protein DCC43_13775 [Candidatus Brocadia sp.]|nr:hypothetical protein [Candidatus Brocadia fulgida]MCC6326724.1 hypothetical protein [Candidatus Brocadia sp.]MCE7912784.1 hypothetical protein [Candidatus Brocadia sp. AMX3]MDG5997350.1 hypothetical protein [Candidatus Brocadia sp.]RIJ92188.1 MAG: hypothetical protein DCC43_13775 [Candidatus Brocadia sp.]
MDKLCLSVLNYYKSQIVSLWSIIAQKRYRERYRAGTGKDPLVCPQCGQEMDICTIWHPRHGVIYDELNEIKRGKYEQSDVQGVITIPWSVLSESPLKALSS